MLDKIKKIAGINNDDFDSIITSYIKSAESDLEQVGIILPNELDSDALIFSAINAYVMSKIDLTHSDIYYDSYVLQKDALRHYSKYKTKE